jgi:citrate lyase subunit beta/citryl-CoA lyase
MIAKLRRSMLYAPGNNPAMVRDVHIYGADSVMFDLEDGVAPAEKDAARLLVWSALRSLDYGSVETVIRVNGLDTPWADADIEAAVSAGVDAIRLPKAERPEDVRDLESRIARAEARFGRVAGSTRIVAAIEGPLGLINCYDIARSSTRLVAIALAAEDYVTALKTTRSADGVELVEARGRIVVAARAAGIMAIDTVFTDIRDEEGFLREARLAKQMGFDGKSLVNPVQVPLVHGVWAPTAEEARRARRVVAAAREAAERGLGVISLDGKMIDKPIVERAERIIELALASGARLEAE